MNKTERITWDEGTRFSLHDPRLASLPPHPTPEEFEGWLQATRVMHGAGRWTRSGAYGAQFALNLRVDTDAHDVRSDVYLSGGCGYQKNAFCFLHRAIEGAFKRAGYPPPVYDDHHFETYLKRIGLICIGASGID